MSPSCPRTVSVAMIFSFLVSLTSNHMPPYPLLFSSSSHHFSLELLYYNSSCLVFLFSFHLSLYLGISVHASFFLQIFVWLFTAFRMSSHMLELHVNAVIIKTQILSVASFLATLPYTAWGVAVNKLLAVLWIHHFPLSFWCLCMFSSPWSSFPPSYCPG